MELTAAIELLEGRSWSDQMLEIPRLVGLATALGALGRIDQALDVSARAIGTLASTDYLNLHGEALLCRERSSGPQGVRRRRIELSTTR